MYRRRRRGSAQSRNLWRQRRSTAAPLTTVPFNWTRIAKFSSRSVPFVVLSSDRVNQTFGIPTAHRVRIFLQSLRKIAFASAMCVNPYDPLALFLSVLDLPVNPFAVLCLWRDIDEKC